MAQYEVDKEHLKWLIRRDCEAILGFYLGEELTLDIPEFHKEIWDEFLWLLERANDPEMLTGTLKKLLGVPREHAKTTLVKVALILFFRYSRFSFCAYISNTFGAALNALKDIKDWLLSTQEQQLYGPITKDDILKSSDTEGLYIIRIWLEDGSRKVIIMKAFGVQTQIRGTLIMSKRPDLMVFDDVESQETANSPMQQAKLDAWCLGTALKSMAKVGIAIFIGNMIAETSLLARLSKEKDWNPTVFGCIIKSQEGEYRPLWEGRWTLRALLEDYASYRRLGTGHVWEAEMMNLTSSDILGESLANAVRPIQPMPEDITAGFICLDPAFGTAAHNDESAITVHAHIRGSTIPCVIDKWTGRVKDVQLLDHMLEMSFKWGLTSWVIESEAAQKVLISLFRTLLQVRMMSPDLFAMFPITAQKKAKPMRINAFRAAVASGSYAIAEPLQDLVERLEAYVPGVEHDDLEDSAAYGILVWELHGTTIESMGRFNVMGALFHTGSGDSGNVSAVDMGL